MSKSILTAGLLGVSLVLTACMPEPTTSQAPAAAATPVATKAKKGDVIFNYVANGKTYRLHTRYDSWLKAHGTDLTIVSGGKFDGSADEDREAQNTIRDAFRSQGICGAGLHPGLTQFAYGFVAERAAWGAKVKCTDKRQSNI